MRATETTHDLSLSVYVKGVSRNATEDEVHGAFSKFGSITDVILKEGRNFALVCYETADQAKAALAAGSVDVAGFDATIEARNPRDKPAARPSANVYLNNLSEQTTQEQVESALSAFGQVLRVEVQADRGFAYASFESEDGAAAAVDATPISLAGMDCNVEFRRSRAPRARNSQPRRESTPINKQVYVKGLDQDCDEETLSAVFAAYGTIASVDRREGRDFGFVAYEDASSVEAAVAAGENGIQVGGNTVTVEERKSGGGRKRRRRPRGRREDNEMQEA